MKIEYILANKTYYYPIDYGTQKRSCWPGIFYDVCFIKKLWFGRWQIDYFDPLYGAGKHGENQTPNTRLILYPSGISEIKYAK